jgi:hypothetical protein
VSADDPVAVGGDDPGATHGLDLDHPARERLADRLLGWGQPRPVVAHEQVGDLRASLETGLAELGEDLQQVADAARGRRLMVTKSALDRLACDGWQRDPRPYEHQRANVRGTLTHRAIERDWDEGRRAAPRDVVERVWHAEATRRPGDPASLSRWLNDLPAEEAGELRVEVADLLAGFREVWPPLPADRVVARVERPIQFPLAGGLVVLRGVPDLVLDSRRLDDRARSLVVDLKTGRPRSEHDRHELRFYALLVALHDGRLPFRWATYYVTEGRAEPEDLRVATLEATVRRVLDGVRQLLRVAGEDAGLRLRGGAWCAFCLREHDCDEADRARRERALSHPDATLGP